MKKNNYKIICIAQIYNELEKGNLKRFVKYALPLCNALVIYDDASTDGSYEYMKKVTPYVIRGKKNDFENEVAHKALLLEKAKELGADFVFYLDADEVLSNGAKEKLQKLAQMCVNQNIDGLQFHKINLWRSKTWERTDSLYDIGWFTHFWRITPETKFGHIKKGLHQDPNPPTLKNIKRTKEIAVLHYGFATEKNLAYKYLTYKSFGQRGYIMLDRLISEEKLDLKQVSRELFPKGLFIEKEVKHQKQTFFESLLMVEKYRKKPKTPKYSIVCLIYKSTDWLQFVYEQVMKYTDMSDKEFFFVANDATEDVLNFLKQYEIPHYAFNNAPKHKKEWYINNVYRAYNYGVEKAKGEYVLLINSDMAFSPYWVENLTCAYTGKNCVVSRMVESGALPSGLHAISKNFGRNISSYKEIEFLEFAEKIKIRRIKNDGLYGPIFIKKSDFLSVGGYPEGNIVPGSDIWKPKIAKQGEMCIAGDVILMERLKSNGIKHQTVFNSIVYHFQEGEKGTKKQLSKYLDPKRYVRKVLKVFTSTYV